MAKTYRPRQDLRELARNFLRLTKRDQQRMERLWDLLGSGTAFQQRGARQLLQAIKNSDGDDRAWDLFEQALDVLEEATDE